jgi:hypothetical protein
MLWKYLGIVSATAAVVKPLLGLTKRIKDYEGALIAYRTLEFELRELKTLIEQKRKYDSSIQVEFSKVRRTLKGVVAKPPETRENSRIKRKCETAVELEFPEDHFFVPED